MTMALSASAISAWLHTASPSQQIFLENGSRTTAPGCQSGRDPGGRTVSTVSTSNARSCTHGAKTLVIRRPAACRPNDASEGISWCTSPMSNSPRKAPPPLRPHLPGAHRLSASTLLHLSPMTVLASLLSTADQPAQRRTRREPTRAVDHATPALPTNISDESDTAG